MAHPVVEQLRFTRGEWRRGLTGLTEREGARHFGQMNSIGWIVGHLTWQEQRYLLFRNQGVLLAPEIQEEFYSGAPMSTPSLAKMLKTWRKVTKASEPFLDSLTTKGLQKDLPLNGKSVGQSQGSAILRMTHHYWFHIGEIQAIRQLLGHKKLPIYVGNQEGKAPYRAENGRG
jgi:DinB family protein